MDEYECIIYNHPETNKAVMIYATPEYLKAGNKLETLVETLVPKGADYKIIKTSELKRADRYFRDAWVWNFESREIDIDMEKAREVHMGRLKYKRTLKWKEMGVPENINKGLDAHFTDTDKKTLKSLRNLDKEDLSKFEDPESLKAFAPSYLKD